MPNIRVMYDPVLLRDRMAARNLNFYRLGLAANVDPKTAKTIVTTGKGQPDKVYLVAKALGFPVAPDNLRPIMKRKRVANGRRKSA